MVKRIIISVHDVSLKYKKELIEIFSKLKYIKNKEAFVILNWENSHNLKGNKKFIAFLKKNFSLDQINLHGLTHDGEFINNSYRDKANILDKSITLFKLIFKKSPEIFIPPNWNNSKDLIKACKNSKISYTEDKMSIIDLKNNKRIFSLPICYDYGYNNILNKLSRAYAYVIIFISYITNSPLRYTLHPLDISNGNFKMAIRLLNKLLSAGWVPMTNKEFWNRYRVEKC